MLQNQFITHIITASHSSSLRLVVIKMADKISPATTTTTAVDTAGGNDKTRLIAPRYTLTERLKYAFLAWAWEALLLTPMFLISEGKNYFKPRAEKEPDLIKTYPVRKKLPVR